MHAQDKLGRPAEQSKMHSPFEVLLAVSGKAHAQRPVEASSLNLSSSPSPPSKQSAYSQDGGALDHLRAAHSAELLDSNRRTAEPGSTDNLQNRLREDLPEGVGTSGGGGSGDTDNSSNSSRGAELEDDNFPREESSGIRTAAKSRSWGARSPSQSQFGRKQRMMWTTELHERFLNAVKHLGMKNAVPKTILRMMNVDGMTRENVASHLQKYRMYLKRQAGSAEAAEAQSAQRSGMVGAPPVAQGVPAGTFASLLGPLPPPTLPGMPAVGLPVHPGFPNGFALGMSYIPPQAWAAGVPGYDALQALRSLSSPQLPPASHAAAMHTLKVTAGFGAARGAGFAPPSAMVPATLDAPVLDIKPLETMPRQSSPANFE